MTRKEHRRRYRLHQKVKNKCLLDSHKRTISVPHGYKVNDKYMRELIDKFPYNSQQEIIPAETIEVINPEILYNGNNNRKSTN